MTPPQAAFARLISAYQVELTTLEEEDALRLVLELEQYIVASREALESGETNG